MDGKLAGLTARLIALAAEAGLDRVGVCVADPFASTRLTISSRKSTGMSARLGFTFTDPDCSTDIRRSFSWAERLVVGIRSYLPRCRRSGANPTRPGTGGPIRGHRRLPTPPVGFGETGRRAGGGRVPLRGAG